MFCPNCASQATDGQRYCRQCGTNLGVIVDAIENKREPVDFERLKLDLKDLGSSLRTGWEQAQQEIRSAKETKRIHGIDLGHFSKAARKASVLANNAAEVAASHEREIHRQIAHVDRSIRTKMKRAERRQSAGWHFQQGILKILTGGAGAGVWYFLLNTAASSGLLTSIELAVHSRLPEMSGLVPFIQMLWMLGLIPMAVGLGHLMIGGFLGVYHNSSNQTSHPETEQSSAGQTSFSHSGSTREIPPEQSFSITEEKTVPLTPSGDNDRR